MAAGTTFICQLKADRASDDADRKPAGEAPSAENVRIVHYALLRRNTRPEDPSRRIDLRSRNDYESGLQERQPLPQKSRETAERRLHRKSNAVAVHAWAARIPLQLG